ncbi:hypothetical protein AMTRI_Chr06g195610 [Amborella trichopoda]
MFTPTSYKVVFNGYPQDGMIRNYVRNFPAIFSHDVETSYSNLHVIINKYLFLTLRNSIFRFQGQESNGKWGIGSNVFVGSSFMFIYTGLDSLLDGFLSEYYGPKTLLI